MHPALPASSPPHWTSFTWPRTYRSGRLGAAVLYLFGASLAVGGALALGAIFKLDAPTPARVAVLVFVAVACFALGAAVVLETTRSRYTLSLTAIECEGILGRRSLRRDEIAGFYLWVANGIATYRMIPSVAGRKHIDVCPFGLATDNALLPWILSLTDLAAAAQDAARAEALADPAMGDDATTRAIRLDSAVRTAKTLNAAALIVCLWVWIYPRP